MTDGPHVAFSAQSADRSGVVFVFDVRSGILRRSFVSPIPSIDDGFGAGIGAVPSAPLSDWAIAIGAPGDEPLSGPLNSGTVTIFDLETGSVLSSFSGNAVDEGAGLSIGSPGAFPGTLAAVARADGGALTVIDGATGVVQRYISNPSGAPGFGSQILLHDGSLFVASPQDGYGMVYAFDITTGALVNSFANPTSSQTGFGSAIAVGLGPTLLIGAPEDAAGAVFAFDSGTATVLQTWTNPSPASALGFGRSLFVSENSNQDVLVGATDGTLGAVYLLDIATGNLLETIPPPDPTIAGFGASITAASRSLVITAPGNGSTSGSGYIYSPCGDGQEDYGETCDDGNQDDGDCCSQSCQIEPPDNPCTSTSCTNPWSLRRTITAPETLPGSFGSNLEALDNKLLIAKPFASDGTTYLGQVYLTNPLDGTVEQTYTNPNPAVTLFGSDIAARGDDIIIGAPADSTLLAGAGAAYIFDRIAGTLKTSLFPPLDPIHQLFGYGYQIAAHPTGILVTSAIAPALLVDPGTGTPVATFSRPPSTDNFGYAATISDGRIYIGAPAPENLGHVYVFNASTGALESTIDTPSGTDVSWFGISLAVVGSHLYVGAHPLEPEFGGHVYEYDTTTGTLVRDLIAPIHCDRGMFGFSLAATATTLFVGAPSDTDGYGKVFVFDVATGALLQVLQNPTTDVQAFGYSLATLSDGVAVGATGSNTHDGAVFIYSICGDGQLAPGEACDDGNLADGDGCSSICTIESASTSSTSTTSTTITATTSTTTTLFPPDPSLIAPPVDPTVATDIYTATRFLYTGTTPIQTGMAANTIDARHAAVIRGRIQDRAGEPIPGVRITILDHPEFGQTFSRPDGRYDLAVNGGGLLTIVLENSSFLPVHRQVDVPWQDFVAAPDVVMVALDSANTEINFATSATVQVHRANPASDSSGSRQATIVVQSGTTATLIGPHGAETPAALLHLRATEYTIGPNGPAAMPAPLPPNSGYTYAVELSADEAIAAGATSVIFNQPVAFYVENFLGFPTGMAVPAGFYDRQRGIWVPSDNGRVVKVISISAGLVNLDIDGDDIADDPQALTSLGITTAEREAIAQIYSTGQSVWRVLIPHFSPWDCNWPRAFGDGAVPPSQEPPDNDDPEDDPLCARGSILACQNQTLGERIPITGTPFSLNYRSDRVRGRRSLRTLDIPVSGATTPPGLKRIEVEITVAGRVITETFPPVPAQHYSFEWDGYDVYGRLIQGSQPVTVRIYYIYNGYYVQPASGERAFGRFSETGEPVGAIGRVEMPLQQTQQTVARVLDAKGLGLGGWMVNVQHLYVPSSRRLYLGNGEQRSASLSGPVAKVVAGNGTYGHDGDGQPAVGAMLEGVTSLAFGRDGSLFIAEASHIRRVNADGIIQTIAGGGSSGPGDNGPALDAEVSPSLLATGPSGEVFFVDMSLHTVRKIDRQGNITKIAGNGSYSTLFQGEGQLATDVSLPSDIAGLAVGRDGTVYIAVSNEYFDNGIYQVGGDGIIHTVAPNALSGNQPGPAAAVGIYGPRGLFSTPEGDIFVASGFGDSVFKLTTSGNLERNAGGDFSDIGDGGSALFSGMEYPSEVTVGRDGTMFVLEGLTSRIRAITSSGIVTSLAGRGTNSADGSPARTSTVGLFSNGRGLAVAPDGVVYFGRGTQVLSIGPMFRGLEISEKVVPSENGDELYVFDGRGRHLRTLDGRTFAPRYVFGLDDDGRLLTITDAAGRITTIQRDSVGNPTSIVGPGGQTTTLAVDNDGYLHSVTNPAGERVVLTYGGNGLLVGLRTPRMHDYSFAYGTDGRVIEDISPIGGTQHFSRSGTSSDYTVTRTTTLNLAAQYRVNRDGVGDKHRPVVLPYGGTDSEDIRQDGTRRQQFATGSRVESSDAPDPRFGMQTPVRSTILTMPSGLQRVQTSTRTTVLSNPADPFSLTSDIQTDVVNGLTTTREYDAATRSLTETTPTGRTFTTIKDAFGRITTFGASGFAPFTLHRNERGLVDVVTIGTGDSARAFALTHDQNDRILTLSDSLSHTTTFGYDAADRIVTETRHDGTTFSYAYDASGNLSSVSPPGQPPHLIEYSPTGVETSYLSPAIGTDPHETTTAYNVDGAPLVITRADGSAINLSYDTSGRLTGLGTSAESATLSYDNTTGHLTSVATLHGGLLTHSYDGDLRTSSSWTGEISGNVSKTYDSQFRTSATIVNGSLAIPKAYDSDNLLVATGDLTLSRDAASGAIIGSGIGIVSDNRTYNQFGEITGITTSVGSTPLLAITYSRDAAGRIVDVTEAVGGGPTTIKSYVYDDAGRLSTVDRHNGTVVTYSYDMNGNRLTRFVGPTGATETGTYDTQDRLLTYAATSYNYTPAGDLAAKTDPTQNIGYEYDALGNLREVTWSGTVIDYVIDPENRRIGKRLNGTLVQSFLWEDALRPAAELDGAGNIVARFAYGTRPNVPDYIVKHPDTPQAMTYRVVTDHLGSPRLIVRVSDGAVAQELGYDEFGRVLIDTNPGFQPFGFAGGLYDHDTGLVRFGARDYDARTGRWTTKDAVRFRSNETNLYRYANGDPINAQDPKGFWTISGGIRLSGGGGIGGAIGGYINVGYSAEAGLSFSVTTAPEVGGYAGTGLAGEFIGQYTRLPSVCHLKGPFTSLSGSAGIGAVAGGGVVFDTAGNVVGYTVNAGYGAKSLTSPVVVTAMYSDTISLVSYDSANGLAGPSH